MSLGQSTGRNGVLDRVEIMPFENDNLELRPHWKDVDRPETGGWCFRSSERKLIERLKQCMEDGKAFAAVPVEIDINGKTFVQSHPRFPFKGVRLDRELKALGY